MHDEILGKKKKKKRTVAAQELTPERRKALAEREHSRLPAPGDERREVLRRRAAELEEEAEEASAGLEGGVADIEDIDIEAEIARHFNQDGQLTFSRMQDDFEYAWVCYDYPLSAKGQAVRMAQTLRWEVVQGRQMPEGHEFLQADGTRRVGDTILMRRPKSVGVIVKQAVANVAAKQRRRAGKAELSRLGDDERIKIANVDLEDPQVQGALNRQMARQIAANEFAERLKEGNI